MTEKRLLSNRVAIVTAAGHGIGRAIATALGDAKAAVAVASRALKEVEETAATLRGRGHRSLPIAADMTDWESVQALVERTVREFGAVHILVNNAGVQGPIGPLVPNDPEEWLRRVQTNLVGTSLVLQGGPLPHDRPRLRQDH